jgi:hypothetical protein
MYLQPEEPILTHYLVERITVKNFERIKNLKFFKGMESRDCETTAMYSER